MTPEQHRLRIQDLERMLYIADYGMGMPRDYNEVLRLTVLLNEARKEAGRESTTDVVAFVVALTLLSVGTIYAVLT